jgi:hypothetical protein
MGPNMSLLYGNGDWGTLGPALLGQAPASWTANFTGLDVTLSLPPGSTASLVRADNVGDVSNGSGGWIDSGFIGVNGYAGMFDGPSNTMPYGDHLVGVPFSNDPLIMSLSTPERGVGFRISAAGSDVNLPWKPFDVTLMLFDNATASGTPIDTFTFTHLSGGGLCKSLSQAPYAPVDCNNAPFIGAFSNSYQILSIKVFTSDATTGYYIDSFRYRDAPVPESGTVLMTLSGLAILVIARRRRRGMLPGAR